MRISTSNKSDRTNAITIYYSIAILNYNKTTIHPLRNILFIIITICVHTLRWYLYTKRAVILLLTRRVNEKFTFITATDFALSMYTVVWHEHFRILGLSKNRFELKESRWPWHYYKFAREGERRSSGPLLSLLEHIVANRSKVGH